MWTFGCVNCRNILPALKDWHARFAERGLVVIGNHYPEFGYEADLDNLKQAVADLGISYPIVQDNTGDNFRAYRANYWPTIYLIDGQGRLRYVHIGEGEYEETEQVINALLDEEQR
jgi:thiol-disulfide isomerase/thioredoxin